MSPHLHPRGALLLVGWKDVICGKGNGASWDGLDVLVGERGLLWI